MECSAYQNHRDLIARVAPDEDVLPGLRREVQTGREVLPEGGILTEGLIPGPYFVFGLPFDATDLEKHRLRTSDYYHCVWQLMREPGELSFVVADIPLDANIFHALKRKNRSGREDHDLWVEAKNRARLIGIRETLFINAVQRVVLGIEGIEDDRCFDGFDGDEIFSQMMADCRAISRSIKEFHGMAPKMKSRPVQLMSDVVSGNQNYSVLYERLLFLARRHPDLIELLLNCSPEPIIKATFGKDKEQFARHLRENGFQIDKELWLKLVNIFRYSITEIAVTLLSGPKYGHDGERVYDQASLYVYQRYGQSLGVKRQSPLRFCYPRVTQSGRNPYSTCGQDSPVAKSHALSPIHEFPEEDFMSHMEFVDFILIPIYRAFFEEIEKCPVLSPAEKIYMKKIEASKILHELEIAKRRLEGVDLYVICNDALGARITDLERFLRSFLDGA